MKLLKIQNREESPRPIIYKKKEELISNYVIILARLMKKNANRNKHLQIHSTSEIFALISLSQYSSFLIYYF